MKKQRSHGKRSSLPGREEVLAFIAENPGQAGKREIARAFGIKGNDKIALKALLKDLAEDGLIEKHGKRLMRAGDLPGVTVLDVTGRDSGGGLLARPTAWDELSEGNPPRIEILPPRGKRPVVAGIGDRVLARLDRIDEAQYNARVIKVIDKRKNAVLGILRVSGTAVRLEPVQKRSEEVALSPDDIGEAKNGDLVEVQVSRVGRHGLKRGKVIRVIGSLASEKAVSMIAIHAHELPHIFPPEALKEAESVKPISAKDARKHEDWRDLPLLTIDPADAKDHDDAIHGARDPDVEGGHIVTVAIADVAWYVRSGSAMDAEALKRGNSVYFPDRVVPMLPERISNDLCSLRENEDRPALAVRMWFDAGGRKTKHEFHRIVMKSHAKLAYTQAQAAYEKSLEADRTPSTLAALQPHMERHFAAPDLAAILASLRAADGDFAGDCLKVMGLNSPLSMACTIEMIHRLRTRPTSIRDALKLEYRYTWRAMQHGDFLEGIRAQIIDKDRNPRWQHPDMIVPAEAVSRMLEPLGPDGLTFERE